MGSASPPKRMTRARAAAAAASAIVSNPDTVTSGRVTKSSTTKSTKSTKAATKATTKATKATTAKKSAATKTATASKASLTTRKTATTKTAPATKVPATAKKTAAAKAPPATRKTTATSTDTSSTATKKRKLRSYDNDDEDELSKEDGTQNAMSHTMSHPAKKARGRPKRVTTGTVTTVYATEPTPGLKSAVSRPTTKVTGSLKKTVTFEEPDKENMLPGAPKPQAKASETPSQGMRARPVRKPTTISGRITRASARAAATNATEKKPLSPRKDVQNRALSRDAGSDDELASPEKTAQSPGSVFTSMLSSPARRPPTSPVKNTMMSPAKRLESIAELFGSSTTSEEKTSESPTKSSMLQSPAKRPHMPLQASVGSSRSPLKTSLLGTPAKRPVSPMKLFKESPKAYTPNPPVKITEEELQAEIRRMVGSPPDFDSTEDQSATFEASPSASVPVTPRPIFPNSIPKKITGIAAETACRAIRSVSRGRGFGYSPLSIALGSWKASSPKKWTPSKQKPAQPADAEDEENEYSLVEVNNPPPVETPAVQSPVAESPAVESPAAKGFFDEEMKIREDREAREAMETEALWAAMEAAVEADIEAKYAEVGDYGLTTEDLLASLAGNVGEIGYIDVTAVPNANLSTVTEVTEPDSTVIGSPEKSPSRAAAPYADLSTITEVTEPDSTVTPRRPFSGVTLPSSNHNRRKSMEPKAVANKNGTLTTPKQPIPIFERIPQTVPNNYMSLRGSSTFRVPSPSEFDSDEDAPSEPSEMDWEATNAPILSPFPQTPDPESVARFARDVTPGTPTGSSFTTTSGMDNPVMQTCPPKASQVLDIGEGFVNRGHNQTVMERLMEARRKTMQFAPKVASPLKKQWRDME
ncbi:hypothetical protein F5Y08DRAFT_282251 [Xylaria arbuscula]|nr:hypothetical protein F5Y08DRAFT_282251 [Xylaria arbuscula]